MFHCVHSAPQGEVWRCDLSVPPSPVGLASLSSVERVRAQRFVFERDRVRFVAAHVALRELLAEKLQQPAHTLQFDTGQFGKPYLPRSPTCHFNLTHSEDLALIAVSHRSEVGVDIERLRDLRDAEGLVERHFSPSEQRAWREVPFRERAAAFHQTWARKEAVVKALGWGLNLPLETVMVGTSTEPHTLDLTLPYSGSRVRVGLCTLLLEPGWAGALAWTMSPTATFTNATSELSS